MSSEGCCTLACVWARDRGRAELMTFCNCVGVNGAPCSREKDVVFNQECGITSARLQPGHSVGVLNSHDPHVLNTVFPHKDSHDFN